MENASKALLIAGVALIAILILSIAIYLFTLYSNQAKEYNDIISGTELQKFNSKFDVYIGRDDITAQEIASVFNLAKEYQGSVEIQINKTFSGTEEFVKEFFNSTFSCTDSVYDNNTGKIVKLVFKEN